MNKLIGEVIALHPARGGFAARVYRYPSGRKLPEPRVLLLDGQPFASRTAALDALNTYRTSPQTVKPLRQLPKMRRAKPSVVAPPATLLRNSAFSEPEPARRKGKRRKNVDRVIERPAIVKMPEPTPASVPVDPERMMLDLMIASGVLKVTRCPDAARQWDSKIDRKHGGVMPSHLDPRTIGETLEQAAEREREQIAAPHNERTSRRMRVRRG